MTYKEYWKIYRPRYYKKNTDFPPTAFFLKKWNLPVPVQLIKNQENKEYHYEKIKLWNIENAERKKELTKKNNKTYYKNNRNHCLLYQKHINLLNREK